MSYLLDRKNKRRKVVWILALVLASALFVYFRDPIFNGLSGGTQTVFRPVIILKNKVGSGFSNIGAAFSSKVRLARENEELKNKILENEARMSNYTILFDENLSLKDMLDRRGTATNLTLSAILSKPNRSPYDTLLIDIGLDHGIEVGDLVFALGNIPIGKIGEVQEKTSKVILFSTAGEKTEVILSGMDAFVEIIGRGGGNFELTLPRDFSLSEGTSVTLPGMFPHIVASVETIISDPRDSFSKALLVTPVNIQELRFVGVRN